MGVLDAPIYLALKPSRRLAVAIGVTHLGALGILIPLTVPITAKIALAILLVCGCRQALRAHYFQSIDAISGLYFDPVVGWQVRRTQGPLEDAELLLPACVLPWLTVLRFRKDGGQIVSAILLPERVDPAAFRRLRVRLKTAPSAKITT